MVAKTDQLPLKALKVAMELHARNYPDTKLSKAHQRLIREAIEELVVEMPDPDFLASYAINRARRRRG